MCDESTKYAVLVSVALNLVCQRPKQNLPKIVEESLVRCKNLLKNFDTSYGRVDSLDGIFVKKVFFA